MLPVLQYQSTLIQAFDPARFRPDRHGERSRLAEARTEVLLNLLFGREIVLPAGHIADSPAVATVYLEVMGAFDRLPLDRKFSVRNKPFRIALEASYLDYDDYVEKYVDVGSPVHHLPMRERRIAEERANALSHV